MWKADELHWTQVFEIQLHCTWSIAIKNGIPKSYNQINIPTIQKKSSNHSITPSFNQSINQSINWSIDQSINQSIKDINQSMNQWINPSHNHRKQWTIFQVQIRDAMVYLGIKTFMLCNNCGATPLLTITVTPKDFDNYPYRQIIF